MTRKVGRPSKPQEQVRNPGISIRLTQDEVKLINEAATRCGIRLKSEFARKALLYVATNDIRLT